MRLNDRRFNGACSVFFSRRADGLAAPKGWKGLEGVNPLNCDSNTANSKIDNSNCLQLKTTLFTPSNPSGWPN